jgi:hypothetical protein
LQLFEVPLQLLDCARVKRAFPFVSDNRLERPVGVRELPGKHESDRPKGQRAKQAGVTLEDARSPRRRTALQVQEYRSRRIVPMVLVEVTGWCGPISWSHGQISTGIGCQVVK